MPDQMMFEDGGDKKKPGITTTRLAIWIVGGVFAVYLIVSGLVGILT